MKRNLTPIASAVAMLMLSAAAQAQQADAVPAKAASDVAVEQIVVTGIRGSLQQSLNQKRNSDSHLEVVTAEDIGKMPDKNVADSLQRLPGVTTSSSGGNEGGFDENDRISMRGTNPSLTQTLINGHNVASGDWFVLGQTGTVGRSVSYTLLPSELVSRVEVHKSSEASLVEGGVAGSVDIITRKPLDFKQQLTVEGSIGEVYADLPKKSDPQFSALINWKNDANTMGVMLQAFSETRHLRRDGQEELGYEQIAAGSKIATSNPNLSGAWYPTAIGSALFEQKRERKGGLIDVQIKPSNDLTLDLSGFDSKMDAANYNRNFMVWNTHFINQGAGQAPDPGYTVKTTNGVSTLTNATFTGVPGTQYGIYDQISRPDESASSDFLSLDLAYRVNDKLKVKAKLGTSTGHGKTPTQDVAEWDIAKGTGASYGLNGVGGANASLGSNNNASQAGSSLDWIFGVQNVDVVDKEKWGQFDAEYALNEGVFTNIKFGVREADHNRSSWGVIAQGANGAAGAFNPANVPVSGTSYPSNFGAGLGGSFPTNIWTLTAAQLSAFDSAYANRASTREYWPQEYGLSEKSRAAYVQADMEGAGWSGNFGVRVVQTKESAINNINSAAGVPGAVTTSAFGPYLPVDTVNTYNDVLPSLSLRFDVNKDVVARVSASETMTRPDYSSIAGSVSLTPPAVTGGVGSGSGPNPNLAPIKSNNLDGTLEWYFAPRSLASVSAFYMDLTSYVGLNQVTQSYLTPSNAFPNGSMVPYTLTVPVNTTGKVSGLELAYEMPLMSNFGFSTNLTLADAKDTSGVGTNVSGGHLVGASKETFNLSGYFENDNFNARLTYNYRSSFFSGLDRSTAFYQAAVGSVAASFGYKINEHLALSLDAQNLNNPKLKYYALNEDQPRSTYESGRQFYLTLRGKM